MTKELRKIVIPEFIFGFNSRKLIGSYAKNLGAEKVLIVTDSGIISSGWVQEIIESLEASDIKYHVFSSIFPNPRDIDVMVGTDIFLEQECNFIVAVGGGSPMDCAKGIAIVATNGGHIVDYEGVDSVPYPGPPLVCIPSTSGTSADVSQFAIILNTMRLVKIAIISKKVVPDLALIDPELLTTMDDYLTACTGMDALTHAIEAYVSNASSSFTDLHALEAIRLISKNLLPLYRDRHDEEALNNMMLASLHAGIAFSNASLGGVHAMAHSLGGLFDLPHGECNSILLEHVIDHNFEFAKERYMTIAEALGVQNPCKETLIEAISGMRHTLGIKAKIDLGIKSDEIQKLAEFSLQDPCMVTNPTVMSKEDVIKVFERVLCDESKK
ncbi:alcohol dehydrogenase-like regulatory protein ErcA [Fusibacter ferrireducens]|uniref:Iron-containing alcohol dehydrogenase n=1 Tax=Fusibacter ferrireducens TaxID=2785058 RepID=A0ABR9ZRX2_9FIRM|nr:alcohol dehydrogenase-like regulatory protein ErcA [Fusibacter ferrireducens]MBF4693206.1 iron-containing alcohol dehydrogenase [Fusibacter ferrireducens]